ncbi:MAG: glycine--tRNA ligase subunit beta, partial [Polyangiales bacterium]
MPNDLLLEIGCEELPSSFVAGALAALPALVTKRLVALRLTHGEVRVHGTPRRIALVVDDIGPRQPDVEEEVTGPPAANAFDAEGKPTKGAEAFAKKLGLDVGALRVVDTPKGKYVGGTRKEAGKTSKELLPKQLAELIAEIPFRKSMRWGTSGDVAFGRPIHWIVALLGNDEIPVEFAGVKSGRASLGHRFLAPEMVHIERAATYLPQLQKLHVFGDIEGRKKLMVERLHERAKQLNGVLVEDDFLVAENLGLVEEPFVVDGSFDPAFLALPHRLIVDVMRTHQRYFAVVDGSEQRTLMPKYLAVVNTANDPAQIRKGNDSVLRARLSDARFFVETDRKAGLESYAKKLEGIRYHAKLGSVEGKVRRIERIATLIVERLQLSTENEVKVLAQVTRAAQLCKADLASLTVGEFPEMQGHAGQDMAAHAGEPPVVARAIAEHWLEPGDLSTSVTGIGLLVGLADKFDHLVGGFAVGLAPTGANDPFSMRRAFVRAVNAYSLWPGDLPEKKALPSLIRIAEFAYQAYMESPTPLPKGWPELEKELVSFMKARLVSLFDETVELGGNAVAALAAFRAPRDVVEACIEADAPAAARTTFDDLDDLRERIGAIRDARGTPAFARLATAFKRASKITKDVAPGEPDPSKFDHPSEKALWSAYAEARGVIGRATESGDYAKAVEATSAALADPIDTFFDKD